MIHVLYILYYHFEYNNIIENRLLKKEYYYYKNYYLNLLSKFLYTYILFLLRFKIKLLIANLINLN